MPIAKIQSQHHLEAVDNMHIAVVRTSKTATKTVIKIKDYDISDNDGDNVSVRFRL